MLSVLGLDEAELAAYRMLVTGPSGTAMEVSGALGVSVGKATRVIASLEAKGLVARSGTAIDHVVASPPDIALGALIVEHQEGIRQAELEMRALRERYLAASSSRAEQVVDVVRGREAVRQRFNQLQRGARREVLEFVKGDVVAVSVDENVEEEQAISRGVVYRFLLERQTLERPGLMAALSETIQAGVELRVTRELPIRLIVVDREIAMIPLAGATDDQSGGALLLRTGGLLDLAVSLFEVKWRDATRLDAVVDGAVEGSELSARERQILLMLNAGLTDRTVATRLGLSARTVQRYVADMMERAEVDTRLQLGVQGSRGALSDERDLLLGQIHSRCPPASVVDGASDSTSLVSGPMGRMASTRRWQRDSNSILNLFERGVGFVAVYFTQPTPQRPVLPGVNRCLDPTRGSGNCFAW